MDPLGYRGLLEEFILQKECHFLGAAAGSSSSLNLFLAVRDMRWLQGSRPTPKGLTVGSQLIAKLGRAGCLMTFRPMYAGTTERWYLDCLGQPPGKRRVR